MIGRRLARHRLLTPAPAQNLAQVAGEICGVHAQMAPSAELMLGLRVAGIDRKDIREALAENRTLVKTVGLRGTLHLFPAVEVPTWMAANRLRFEAEERRLAQRGVDSGRLSAIVNAIGDIVGAEPISRPDFERELEARVGGWAVSTNEGWAGNMLNWPMALGWAAALGQVCYGPSPSGRISFVRLADWTAWREEDPWEAGQWVLGRFLRAYGPSTPAEFARWLAVEAAVAKRLFDAASNELAEVDVEGTRRWMCAADAELAAEAAPDAVHLLPHFDVFVVGSHPRYQLMPPGSRVAAVAQGTAAGFSVLLVGGRVAGVWERRPKGSRRLLVRVDPHEPLTRRQRDAVAVQAERIAQVLERECELEYGEVALRRHL